MYPHPVKSSWEQEPWQKKLQQLRAAQPQKTWPQDVDPEVHICPWLWKSCCAHTYNETYNVAHHSVDNFCKEVLQSQNHCVPVCTSEKVS